MEEEECKNSSAEIHKTDVLSDVVYCSWMLEAAFSNSPYMRYEKQPFHHEEMYKEIKTQRARSRSICFSGNFPDHPENKPNTGLLPEIMEAADDHQKPVTFINETRNSSVGIMF